MNSPIERIENIVVCLMRKADMKGDRAVQAAQDVCGIVLDKDTTTDVLFRAIRRVEVLEWREKAEGSLPQTAAEARAVLELARSRRRRDIRFYAYQFSVGDRVQYKKSGKLTEGTVTDVLPDSNKIKVKDDLGWEFEAEPELFEPVTDEWVRVEDRLPENHETVLVTNGSWYETSIYNDAVFYGDGEPLTGVTHWQHLPPLPSS